MDVYSAIREKKKHTHTRTHTHTHDHDMKMTLKNIFCSRMPKIGVGGGGVAMCAVWATLPPLHDCIKHFRIGHTSTHRGE